MDCIVVVWEAILGRFVMVDDNNKKKDAFINDTEEQQPHQNHHPWNEYLLRVQAYHQQPQPGLIAVDEGQRCYNQCLACPIDRLELQRIMLILILPLRIHLIRSSEMGCSAALNQESIRRMVEQTNEYWIQANIQFELIQVIEHDLATVMSQEDGMKTHQFLTQGVSREKGQGKMRRILLNRIIRPLQTAAINNTYDVWFVDTIGSTFQGICIDRRNRTVIMGERSTKGYPRLTLRPHACLAKTMAHELGHALGLGHPKNQVFADGKPRILTRHRRNVMTGGSDLQGGGGDYLELWQIFVARNSAEAAAVSQGVPQGTSS